jgi:two-component system chemotaxis sensor kinase CheA
VPSTKLDHIVSLVGELVINESRLVQVSTRLNSAELAAPVEAMERLIAELRDAVLGVRMMPIGPTFSRFKRLVHDLSRDLGKEVELVTEGAETELDKTVIDQLADPLVHLVRNSIDHGIETPAERTAAGKPARGVLRLGASHEGSHVVVTVEDDGRGLNAAAIRAKAVEKQLIKPDAVLGEAEIFNLIFLPDFSTAANVTAVSGRGVGMDVVRKQIDALRGGIQLSSTAGRGTIISLALPLTLAIIDGLLVTIGSDPFIVPMSVVMENVELRRSERSRNNGRNLVHVRGELIPYLHLREMFGLPGEEPELEKIVITRFGRDRVGLVVDRVLGSHQTVIQPLGRMFRDLGVASGGTILGDGRVALILDLSGLVAFAEKRNGAENRRSALAAFGSSTGGRNAPPVSVPGSNLAA